MLRGSPVAKNDEKDYKYQGTELYLLFESRQLIHAHVSARSHLFQLLRYFGLLLYHLLELNLERLV